MERGTLNTKVSLNSWLEKIKNNINIGEILIQRIDFDGMACGYDLDLIEIIKDKLNLPVIILGGLSEYNDFVDAAKKGANGLAAANIWHYKEMVDFEAKNILKKNKIEVRI
ncbi:HisA/HisF-related TIM barrel protein [Candidatus Pelagibacter sp.]|nr:HisA/HisF-related TIM barrel protein [Candidatus Pelagibacter sp.]